MHKKFHKGFSLIELSIVVLVIGIVIAGVVSGSKMILKFKLNAARTLTTSSPVHGIKDLTLWLDTSSEDSFVSTDNLQDGSNVSEWMDINSQTLSKNVTNQPTSSLRPQYKENVVNGLPILRFNDDFLILPLRIDPNDEYTTFIVARSNGDDAGYIFSSQPVGTNRFYFRITSNKYSFQMGVSSTAVLSSGTIVDNKFYLLSSTSGGENPVLKAYIDGDVIPGSPSSFYGTGSVANCYIGTLTNSINADHLFNGDIGEIILFNRVLKNEERKSVENYLIKKWAI